MESKKINQLATSVNPSTSDLAIIGDPITGVSKKITWLQVSSLIGTAANLQQVTDNGATTTNPITIGGLTISGLSTGVLKSDSGVISSVPFGAANGVATLGGDGKVPSSQLPSYVDDVVEVANYAALPAIGETGKIYITLDNNKVYRWTGSTYVEIAANNAVWGSITGTLSNQTDLQNALDAKVPTSRTLSINGTSYDLSANRTWSVGTLTSVGLTMPSGFSVSSSPLTGAGGTIAVTGAGSSTQYIDGTGSLQTFPTLLSSDNLIKLVRNQSGSTMTAGTIVYINGATGNKPTIAKALATSDATSAQTYGFVQADIANNADGNVVVIGNVSNIDTSALTEGQQLYLSGTTAGTWTTTKPYAPTHLVYVGVVLRSHPTQGIIGVKIQNGFEMDELHNVDAYLPNNNDILSYNTSTSLWEHKQIATTLGYTPLSGTGTTNYISKFTGSTSLGNSLIFDNGTQIGINTITPSYTLDVYGSIGTTATIYANGGGGGIVMIGTGTGATSYIVQNFNSNILFLGDQATATKGISINVSTGNVGIGTSIPTNKLSVAGTTAISGQLTLGDTITNGTYTYTLPSATGTIALTSDIPSVTNFVTLNTMQTITGTKVYNSLQYYNNGLYLKEGVSGNETGYTMLGANTNQLIIGVQGASQTMTFPTAANYTYTFPSASGTLALASSLSSYVPTNRTLTINGTTYDLSADRSWTISGSQWTTSGSNIYYNTGNVGIGSSSPSFAAGAGLVISSATRSNLSLTDGTNAFNIFQDSTSAYFNVYSSGDLIFRTTTSNTERMRLTSAGLVGIATTDPIFPLRIAANYNKTTTSGSAQMFISTNEAAASSPFGLRFQVFGGASTTNRYAVLQTTDYNSADGGTIALQTGGGSVGIGITNAFALNSSMLALKGSGSTYNFLCIQDTVNQSGATFLQFLNSAGGGVGQIVRIGTTNAVNYNTTSDYRLKEDFKQINGLDKILAIKVYDFKWKDNNSRMDGVIAHELQEIIPFAVSGEKNELDKEGNIKAQGVDYSKIVPALIKAIQELKAEIDELKNK